MDLRNKTNIHYSDMEKRFTNNILIYHFFQQQQNYKQFSDAYIHIQKYFQCYHTHVTCLNEDLYANIQSIKVNMTNEKNKSTAHH